MRSERSDRSDRDVVLAFKFLLLELIFIAAYLLFDRL